MGAVVGLWVLAAWCAECAWGGFTVADYPLVLLFLGPLYGGAAVLIREVARRRGAGWPGIVLLAAAFGLVQAGLVDQSLFDREALAGTEFAEAGRLAEGTLVPVLQVSVVQVFDFVGGHVWLSICAPIALVEACVRPDRRRVAWLRTPGIVVVAVLFLVASVLNWSDSGRVVNGVQVGFVVLVAGALIAAALRPRKPTEAPNGKGPLMLGAVVLGGHLATWFYGWSWWGVAARLATLVPVVWIAVRWARDERHVVAAWGAGVVAAVGAAFLSPPYAAAAPWLMLVSDVIGAVIAAVVLGLAWVRAVDPHPAPVRPG